MVYPILAWLFGSVSTSRQLLRWIYVKTEMTYTTAMIMIWYRETMLCTFAIYIIIIIIIITIISLIITSTSFLVQAILDCEVTAVEKDLVSWFLVIPSAPSPSSTPVHSLSLLTVGFQTYSSDYRKIFRSHSIFHLFYYLYQHLRK